MTFTSLEKSPTLIINVLVLYMCYVCVIYVFTSAERCSVLLVVLDFGILPCQQTSELLHLPLQQVAHDQQGAHQVNTHLKTTGVEMVLTDHVYVWTHFRLTIS